METEHRCPECRGAKYVFTETFDAQGVYAKGKGDEPVDMAPIYDNTSTTPLTRRICGDCGHIWSVVA